MRLKKGYFRGRKIPTDCESRIAECEIVMKIIRDIHQMQEYSNELRRQGRTIAFVPTLGALHEGHISLLKKARRRADILVMSIFLNPLQFSDPKDFKNYPKTMRKDLHLAKEHHVDVLFCPNIKQMYAGDLSTYVTEEGLSKGLCGKSRPGHFLGVTTIVAKLFNLVKPNIAFFGQKDAQQTLIIKRMVRDLNWDIQIEVTPTVRDFDGLALSSRNALLSAKAREQALSLNEALFMAKIMISGGERNAAKIIQRIKKIITSNKLAKIDYIEVVDAETLESIKILKGKVLIALAVWVGKARLIDNILLNI